MYRFTCGERKIWQNIEKSENIMKLIVGSQESVGVKYIDSICTNIILSRDGFKCDPETKFQTILRKASSEAAVRRCSLKKVFLKISHGCFPVNIAKFLRTVFL